MQYPWLETSYSQFSHDYAHSHHAHLICGKPGIGKTQFVFHYAKLQLCQKPVAQGQAYIACDLCQNCRLFEAGSHPDLHLISSEYSAESGVFENYAVYAQRYFDNTARQKRSQAGQFISVDQIRMLSQQFANKAHISERKVALILPADSMNHNAANALLKLLEEPPAESLLILVTAQPGLLLPTIRSRCIMTRLKGPHKQQGLEWLIAQGLTADMLGAFDTAMPVALFQQSQNGKLELRANIRDIIKAVFIGKKNAIDAAAELAKHDFADVIAELAAFAHTLIKMALNKPEHSVNHFTAKEIYAFYDKVVYYRALQRDAINKQMALEVLCSAINKA